MSGVLTTYIIPVVGMFLIVGIYWLFSNRKKSAKRKILDTAIPIEEKLDINDDGELVLARIYDRTTSPSTIYNKELPASVVNKIKTDNDGRLGRRWLRDGKYVFPFNKISADVYTILVPPYNMDNPPTRLHSALKQPEAAIVYDVSQKQNILQKYGPILIWTAVIIFVMWMAVSD